MRCESGICEELRRQIAELEERVDVLTKGINEVYARPNAQHIYMRDFIAATIMVEKYEPLPKPPTHKPHPEALWAITDEANNDMLWCRDHGVHGWVNDNTFSLFTTDEKATVNLPVGGVWRLFTHPAHKPHPKPHAK